MVEQPGPEGRYWISAPLEQPYGRGVNFEWGVEDIDALYQRVQNQSPQSIYMPLESKAYQCGTNEIIQKQFIAQDPDGYLFRFCEEG